MNFGVYVHIPFCAHRCDYCDFATWTDREHLVHDYVEACVTDIERRVDAGMRAATSVFFGGGTPSLIDARDLTRVLAAIPRRPDTEVTVECNPDSVDAGKLAAYHAAGVNRLSFGVQSMRPHVLAALGRTHDSANVERAISLARDAGITNCNVDLIYGTPGESLADWSATLAAALALGVEHISAYALTVEPPTALGQAVAAGRAPAPDDDDQADKYAIADETLTTAGFEWYEVSNWARPGRECRHNQCYWDGSEYVGIGCAAHGFTGGRRWWNARLPERYIERVDAGGDAVSGDERLDATTAAEEAFSLALRTKAGAVADPAADPVIRELEAAGLLARHQARRGERASARQHLVLTRAGRLLASDVTARLLLAGAAGPSLPDPVSTRYD